MLAIARGLMCRPRLLLLDEPSLGLSPVLVIEIFDVIQQIHQEGTPVLLVEQNMNMSLEIVDFAYIMETGRMRLSGSPQEILADGDVREFYLGEGKGKYISRKDRWEGSRNEVRELILRDDLSAADIESVMATHEGDREEMRRLFAEKAARVHAILTPDQRRKLMDLMDRRWRRHN